jgi:hypothetical protein
MSLHQTLLRSMVVVVLLSIRIDCNANMSIYTSSASFAAAATTSSPGLDTFNDLSADVVTPSPLSRTAGPYSYAIVASSGFFSTGGGFGRYLAPNVADDPMQFGEFSPMVFAFGVTLFGADIEGNFRSGLISIVATDSQGASLAGNVSASDASPGAFIGFVSNVPLVDVIIAASGDSYPLWPTITTVTLASSGTVSAVPEPSTWLLLLADLRGLVARSIVDVARCSLMTRETVREGHAETRF